MQSPLSSSLDDPEIAKEEAIECGTTATVAHGAGGPGTRDKEERAEVAAQLDEGGTPTTAAGRQLDVTVDVASLGAAAAAALLHG